MDFDRRIAVHCKQLTIGLKVQVSDTTGAHFSYICRLKINHYFLKLDIEIFGF